MKALTALILDDDPNYADSLALLVKREGFAPRIARSLAEARSELKSNAIDVVLVDLGLPDGDGLEFVRSERGTLGAGAIVITGQATVGSAVDALRGGVLDYLVKPADPARLRALLARVRAGDARAAGSEAPVPAGKLDASEGRELGERPGTHFGPLVGRSKAMKVVYDLIERVAPTDASVLITGESGTGKELVAQTIHQLSRRSKALLLPVNCGAVSPALIESELFGHERGSFTGAERLHKGYFERASGGTLFLDELTEMPLDLQTKLLRVLESGTLLRVGASDPIHVDVRVIAASNRDVNEAVKEGKLREDLFYRLNVFPIALPPLREREGDLELLAEYFLQELNRESAKSKSWTRGAFEGLGSLRLTGNVRELRNLVQRAFILAEGEIGRELVSVRESSEEPAAAATTVPMPVGSSIAEAEQRLILATLQHHGGDKGKAAEILGISLKTLYNRLNVYLASQAGS